MRIKWFFYGIAIAGMAPAFAEDFSASARFGFNQYGFYAHVHMNGHFRPYMQDRYDPFYYLTRSADAGYSRSMPWANVNARNNRPVVNNYSNAPKQAVSYFADPRYQAVNTSPYPHVSPYDAHPYPLSLR